MAQVQVSVIIPTYNESENVVQILKSIGESMPDDVPTEAIIVDDNSPDGTGRIVEEYLKSVSSAVGYTISIVHRKAKRGLIEAILNGIREARGEDIVIMDCDFSHPPSLIPKMIKALKTQCDIAVASRYAEGGGMPDWPIKRRIISRTATFMAKKWLSVDTKDPMSGFFAFKRSMIDGLKFDSRGYKILLEILVKKRDAKVLEIPYMFQDRMRGQSKLGAGTILRYLQDMLKLYRSGKFTREKKPIVKFFSRMARWFTVGASGLAVNYLVSLFAIAIMPEFWYVHANVLGAGASITTNFVLNKTWTFGDRNFGIRHTLSQYLRFAALSSLGAILQVYIVYSLIEPGYTSYPVALFIGVGTAAFGNFVLNKKLTFRQKIFS